MDTRTTFAARLALLGFAPLLNLDANDSGCFSTNKSIPFAKGPAITHGGLGVELASGALDLAIPLGPGLGRPGLSFVPVLRGRCHPHVDGQGPVTAAGFDLSPGFLDVEWGSKQPLSARWSYPDGTRSHLVGTLPHGVDAARCLARFLPGSGARPCGFEPGAPYVGPGAQGDLLVGLAPGGMDPSGFPGTPPPAFLAIHGDLAYVYRLAVPVVGDGIRRAHYSLSAIHDGFGDAIAFTHGPGSRFQASRGSAVIQVTLDDTRSVTSAPSLGDGAGSGEGPAFEATLHIDYRSAAGPGPSFTLGTLVRQKGAFGEPPPEAFLRNLQPLRLTHPATDESVTFTYGRCPVGPAAFAPTVLQSVAFPGREVDLEWEGRPALRCTHLPGQSLWAFGISALTERDLTGHAPDRATRHRRVLPERDPLAMGWRSVLWSDTVTRPDGTLEVFHFAAPDAGTEALAAHLRHHGDPYPMVTLEQRFESEEALRNGRPWLTSTHDRFEFRSAVNPTGDPALGTRPYASRVRTWEAGTGVVSVQALEDWDPASLGWRRKVFQVGTAEETKQPDFDRSVTWTLDAEPACWIWARPVKETRPGWADKRTQFEPGTRRPASVAWEADNALAVHETFRWHGPRLLARTLESPSGLRLSGRVGTTFRYDEMGFMAEARPLGAAWARGQERDDFGRIIGLTDANGKRTTIVRDAGGRTIRMEPPDGGRPTVIRYEDDHLGFTVARGACRTTYRYDGFGQLTQVSRGGARPFHRKLDYDTMGRLTFASAWMEGEGTRLPGKMGPGQTWAYDRQGRLILHAGNGIPATRLRHAGLVTSTDRGSSRRDALGRVVEVADALGGRTRFAYDDADRMTGARQGDHQARTWTFNRFGWLTRTIQPETGLTTYRDFTVTGAPGTVDRAGRILRTSFDTLMRPLAIRSEDGTVDEAFDYDDPSGAHGAAMAECWRHRDGAVEVRRTFGAPGGRLSRMETRVRLGSREVVIPQFFTRDLAGAEVAAGVGSNTVVVDHDPEGMPRAVSRNGVPIAEVSVNAATGLCSTLTLANGVTTHFDRNPAGFLRALCTRLPGGAGGLSWAYDYDQRGRLVSDGEDRYGFDAMDRLTGVTARRLDGAGLVAVTYRYDLEGNLVHSFASGDVPGELSPRYTFNNFSLNAKEQVALRASNRLPATAGGVPTGAEYDAQGHLTQVWAQAGNPRTQLNLAVDALGRVTGCFDARTGRTETYAYDARGLCTLSEIWEGSTRIARTVNVHDDDGRLVSQWEGEDPVWRRDLIHLGTHPLAEVDGRGTRFLHLDRLGRVRMVTGPAGVVVARMKHLPHGETLDVEGRAPQGFTGGEIAAPAGLIRLQARLLLPAYRRFLSPDPLCPSGPATSQSWNRYAFVQGMPTAFADPTGCAMVPVDPPPPLRPSPPDMSGLFNPTFAPPPAPGGPPPISPWNPSFIHEGSQLGNAMSGFQNFMQGDRLTTEPTVTYSQPSGTFTYHSDTLGFPRDASIGTGWSGRGLGKNEPSLQSWKDHGPIPQGDWTIQPPVTHPRLGELAIPLRPREGTDLFGRDNQFYIHGPSRNPSNFGQESHGCPILNQKGRQFISDSGATRFTVAPPPEPPPPPLRYAPPRYCPPPRWCPPRR